jgi:hypothetical protein
LPLPLTCHLAYLEAAPTNLVPAAGPVVLCADSVSRTLPELLAQNSHQQIQLSLDTTRLTPAAAGSRKSVSIADLHEYTRLLTGNSQSQPSEPLTDIVIIYAPALQGHPEIRGMMFDTGFRTDLDDSNWEQWSACCREGCAVFLQSIRDARATDAEAREQAAFTTVHELGHVFNQLHTDDPCFLHTSPDDFSPPRTWYKFNSDNRAYLTDCRQPAVYPGGIPFGDHAYMGNGDVRCPREKGEAPLKLKIKASRDEFLPYEPVELDVKLSLLKGATRPRKLRNELDPSYSHFTIWIEEPGGERRRYQSINHCCSNPEPCKVKPDEPFERDITLFGQSGGYTFRRAGVHRVWITWQLSTKVVLKSNVIEIGIRPTLQLSSKEELLCKVLRKAGRPLFYRRRLWKRSENEALVSLCTDFRGKSQRYAKAMAMNARWHIQREMARRNTGYRAQHLKSLCERGEWLSEQDELGAQRRKKVVRAMVEMEE